MKSRTYTVNQPTRTFSWPLVQKVPWYRRLLSRVPFWAGIHYRVRLRRRLRESAAVWAYMEAQPGFNEEMEQAEADLAAGKGTPWREIRQ